MPYPADFGAPLRGAGWDRALGSRATSSTVVKGKN